MEDFGSDDTKEDVITAILKCPEVKNGENTLAEICYIFEGGLCIILRVREVFSHIERNIEEETYNMPYEKVDLDKFCVLYQEACDRVID